jgi:hypothetical protein
LTVSVTLGETPLSQSLLDRLSRRSPKARVARTALAQEVESQSLTFSPSGGYYDCDVNVELYTGTPNAKILFTTDGSLPTPQTGIVYERPIHLDGSQPNVVVLRARKVLTDVSQLGPVISASYVMNVNTHLPVLSLVMDPADLADLDAHYLSRGKDWERPVHLTYVTTDHHTGFTQAAGLRIRGEGLQPLPKKSFWLYFRQEYGKGKLKYPLFGDGEVSAFDHLVLDAGGNQADKSLRWTLLESEITAQLTRDAALATGGEAPQGQYVVLFLNGQPWGIYDLRERLDDNFLRDHYNIQDADVIENRKAQSGDLENWNALDDFVNTHPLTNPQNLAFVQTQIDLQNFTDYNIIQTYAAHDDWPQNNAVRARPRILGGRWFWLSWDATRGYGATGTPSLQSLADPQSLLASHGRDDPDFDAVAWATRSYALTQHEAGNWLDATLLLRSLLENDDYRAAFISRANDLLNTTLSSESVLAKVDRGVAQLAGDIHFEENRWPSAFDWQTNVQGMREWVRARPDRMRRELMNKFELTGTVTLEFALPSGGAGQGYVVVNDQPVRQLPWRGVYLTPSLVRVTAVPEAGYVFAGWDAPDLGSMSSITLTASVSRTITPHFAPAPADVPRPNDAILNEVWINDNGTRRYAGLGGRPIEGDWFEILAARDKLDMRGWRITDNDTKTATDEGSLILPRTPAFAAVPHGTVILVVVTENESNATNFSQDELDASTGRMILYVGNGALDTTTDPGFGLGRANDNLVLLAPGPTDSFADDVGIDFAAEGSTVTPANFGVLTDGVVFEHPFRTLGNDDGVVFTVNRKSGCAPFDNDDADDPALGDDQPGPGGWLVDPSATYTGDDPMPGSENVLSPGQLNPGQAWALRWGK